MKPRNFLGPLVGGFFPVLLGLLVVGCGAPAPGPLKPDSAAIGLSLEMAQGLFGANTVLVQFVRLGEGAGLKSEGEILTSNYRGRGSFYFLNVPPGRYAAIAAAYSLRSAPLGGGGAGAISFSFSASNVVPVFLPREIVAKTVVAVAPGGFAYMGTYSVDMNSLTAGDADDLQAFYKERVMNSVRAYRNGRSDGAERTAESEQDFLRTALKSMTGSGWEKQINRGLKAP